MRPISGSPVVLDWPRTNLGDAHTPDERIGPDLPKPLACGRINQQNSPGKELYDYAREEI